MKTKSISFIIFGILILFIAGLYSCASEESFQEHQTTIAAATPASELESDDN